MVLSIVTEGPVKTRHMRLIGDGRLAEARVARVRHNRTGVGNDLAPVKVCRA